MMLIVFIIISQAVIAQQSDITALNNHYLGIKNALTIEDGKIASEQALLLLKSVNTINGLNASEQKNWLAQKNKLIAAADAISKTIDVAKQREQLNELSLAIYAVLKSIKVNTSTFYYQYCPMKKVYWVSNEKEIKNPYYGKKMLTCGSVKETIQ